MAEQSESNSVEKASASSSVTAGKGNAGRKSKASKREYGKMTFRLPLDFEHALTLASVQLARAGEEIHTIQQMVDQAIERYMDYLQIKKGVDLMGIVPKKSPSEKSAPTK